MLVKLSSVNKNKHEREAEAVSHGNQVSRLHRQGLSWKMYAALSEGFLGSLWLLPSNKPITQGHTGVQLNREECAGNRTKFPPLCYVNNVGLPQSSGGACLKKSARYNVSQR